MNAKRCPICGGEPQYVYYAVPKCKCPDLWEYLEDGSKPFALWKRVECKDCKTTTCGLFLTCDDAVNAWNNEHIYEFIDAESAEITE